MNDIWIECFSGRKFYPLNPREEDIDIYDIAHSLSMTCRFMGHAKYFYSVAEHSLRVAEICPHGLKLAGLLHDYAEAYIGDIPKPIKKILERVEVIEQIILSAIFKKFNVNLGGDGFLVKSADHIMLATEARDLMEGHLKDYPIPEKPLKKHIVPYPSMDRVCGEFLNKFESYSGLLL